MELSCNAIYAYLIVSYELAHLLFLYDMAFASVQKGFEWSSVAIDLICL